MEKNLETTETYYESIRRGGYSRRDFLKFATFMTAFMGLEHSAIGQVAKALETTPRIPIIWEHFQECTCCSESFIRSGHPIVADIILDKISLDYTLTLMAASGHQAEAAKHETMKKHYGNYILCVEGSVPVGDGGNYCCIAGQSAIDILKESAAGAKAIIAWGSCATSGCVQAAKPNPTGATPINKIITDKPIINVPGCPPIGEVMAGIIVYLVSMGRLPQLDNAGRPKAFYAKRVHDSCYRRPYFDAGLFAEKFDDENAKKGYCLYKLGCKGPSTYNACGNMRWNGGVSFPIQSGHGCIGCSANDFWDAGSFYTRDQSIKTPGGGIEATADTVGKVALGAVAGGIAAHAVIANVQRKKELKEMREQGVDAEKKIKD